VTNALEFDVKVTPSMGYVEEKISGCAVRVVSKDRKLTNDVTGAKPHLSFAGGSQ
jgi:hypothetical protein